MALPRLLWLWPLTFDPPGDARHEYPASGSRVRPGRDASIHFLEAGRRSHETRPLCWHLLSLCFICFVYFFLPSFWPSLAPPAATATAPGLPPVLRNFRGKKKGTLGSSCDQKLAKWYLNEMPRPRRGVRRPRGRSWRPRSGLGGAAASRVQRSFLISVMNMY